MSDGHNDIHQREKRFIFNVDLDSSCADRECGSTVYDFISYDLKNLKAHYDNSTGPFSSYGKFASSFLVATWVGVGALFLSNPPPGQIPSDAPQPGTPKGGIFTLNFL